MKESRTEIDADLDVVVIGGGPAGMSAAVWCSDLGSNVLLIEKEPKMGGQLLSIHGAVTDHIGIRTANGAEMSGLFEREVEAREIRRRTGVEVIAIDPIEQCVKFSRGESVSFRALIFAAGVRRRKLGVEGEHLEGVMRSGVGERGSVTAKTVVIVGGGDAALENAVILSEFAKKIFVIHRRNEFTARPNFVEAARRRMNVEFILDSVVTRIIGDKNVASVEFDNMVSGDRKTVEAERILVRIGVEPNTEILSGIVELDAAGYVKTDAQCRTSVPFIFAAGDAANPVSPTISTAVGTGATAAKAVFEYLNNEVVYKE